MTLPASEAVAPYDHYEWLRGQSSAIASALAGPQLAKGLDLAGIKILLDRHADDISEQFVHLVACITDRLVRIREVKAYSNDEPDWESLPELQADVDGYRSKLADLMEGHPSLVGEYGQLFEIGRSMGIRVAISKLHCLDYKRKRVRARVRRECNYSLEHVAAFDPRPDSERPDGTRTGRAMTTWPDHETFPPDVARVLNAAPEDFRGQFQVIEDSPSRMACDELGTVYARMQSGPDVEPAKKKRARKGG